ncbi:MAG: hypothetical protein EPN55_13080 [Gammaproteobacteria bacterium]|nr:MAG: hypothetical protein EPN55_13080 [Gammaproteobacteria bacterium]
MATRTKYVVAVTLAAGLGTVAFSTAGTGAEPVRVALANPVTPAPAAIAVRNDERATLVFGAPPRESCARESEVYQPLVDHLAKITGKPVVFQCADNWLTYSKNMVSGVYDIVFDGPAFTGWRVDRLQHVPIVRLPEDFVFVVIAKADNGKVKEMKDLAGRLVCAHAPPNLGTLTLLSQFDNPTRQPGIVETKGWDNAMKGLAENKCAGTVVPLKNLSKYDTGEKKTFKVLYRHTAMPNQAISVGSRIPADMQAKILQGLMSAEGKNATSRLRAVYAGADFVQAKAQEYAGLGKLLKNDLYFRH